MATNSTLVPKNIRTNNVTPRAISFIIILAWLPVYYFGVSALTQNTNNTDNQRNIEFHKGTTWHCIQSDNLQPKNLPSTTPDTTIKNYVGYIQTILNSDSKGVEIKSIGAFRFRLKDKPILVKLTLNAVCHEYFKLETFNLKIEFDNNSIIAKRVSDSSSPHLSTVINIDNSGIKDTIKRDLPFPEPIFLIEKRLDYFSLILPRRFVRQLEMLNTLPTKTNLPNAWFKTNESPKLSLDNQNNLSSFLGLSIEELPQDQAHTCRAQVLSEPSQENSNNYIELSKYLRFLVPQIRSSLTEEQNTNNMEKNEEQR